MPKVICKLKNASHNISGVAFEPHESGHKVSEDISEEKAAHFTSIPGYVLESDFVKEEEAAAAAAASTAAAGGRKAAKKPATAPAAPPADNQPPTGNGQGEGGQQGGAGAAGNKEDPDAVF